MKFLLALSLLVVASVSIQALFTARAATRLLSVIDMHSKPKTTSSGYAVRTQREF
ncbi:MAG TPA: hypothetical protein VFS76_13045 [Pyrinomonadaceae bacterium]|nr:hypothetical protein [Pyrinomonadaceae bacterium]